MHLTCRARQPRESEPNGQCILLPDLQRHTRAAWVRTEQRGTAPLCDRATLSVAQLQCECDGQFTPRAPRRMRLNLLTRRPLDLQLREALL